MLEYLFSLLEQGIDVQPFFLELLVSAVVDSKDFGRLQQLLQYRVIADAKPLAFLLLSLEAKHPPLIQLAVDMLTRLGSANEEIVEVLLCNSNVVEAIRFAECSAVIDRINPMKFIEIAWQQSRLVKYAVFSYFLDRLKSSSTSKSSFSFGLGEQYERYAREFKTLYGAEECERSKKETDDFDWTTDGDHDDLSKELGA